MCYIKTGYYSGLKYHTDSCQTKYFGNKIESLKYLKQNCTLSKMVYIEGKNQEQRLKVKQTNDNENYLTTQPQRKEYKSD